MIFQIHECLFSTPFGDLDAHSSALYRRYNSMRTSVKHVYCRLKTLFPRFATGKRLRIMNNGGPLIRMTVAAFLFLNCHTCINGSAATLSFDCFPPTLEEYLPLDEDLPPPPHVDLAINP